MGWVKGLGLGRNNNGISVPIEQPGGILLDKEDPKGPRGFIAPGPFRPSGPRGQYERPVGYLRQYSYPFHLTEENAKIWANFSPGQPPDSGNSFFPGLLGAYGNKQSQRTRGKGLRRI